MEETRKGIEPGGGDAEGGMGGHALGKAAPDEGGAGGHALGKAAPDGSGAGGRPPGAGPQRGLAAAAAAALGRFLSSRSLPFAAAAAALFLTVPSLGNGLQLDDLIHRTIIMGPKEESGRRDLPWSLDPARRTLPVIAGELFSFTRPPATEKLMDAGALPWWTLKNLKASFFRPAAALTHYADYALWPASYVMMHLQSILWYAAAVLAAAFLYRRLAGPAWVAGLAAILFAFDDGHRWPAVWLANRNALLALFFGLLAVAAHDRRRREGRRSSAFLAPVWLAASLLSAEAGVATCAYLFCHALFLDRAPWPRRLLSLIPYAAVVAAWRAFYGQMGYGAFGCGLYTDPGNAPLSFAAAVIERGPVLLLGWLGWPDPATYNLLSAPAALYYRAGAVIVLAAAAVLLIPLFRRDRAARFFGAGMVLAAVPSCGTSLASGRLLLFASFGAAGLTARLAGGLLDKEEWIPRSAARRIPLLCLAALLLFLHGVLSPCMLAVKSRQPKTTRAARFTEIGDLPAVEGKDVVLVNAPSPFDCAYLEPARAAAGKPLPARVRILAPGAFSVEVARLDERTLLVRPDHGWLAPPGGRPGKEWAGLPAFHPSYADLVMDRFFRGEGFPMALGETVRLTGMTARVTALTPDGRPAEARIRFDRPLEDPSLVWLAWNWEKKAYLPFRIPGKGETVRIAGTL